jgi:hypothetical protein
VNRFFKFMSDLSDAIDHEAKLREERDAKWNAASPQERREWDDLGRLERQEEKAFFDAIKPAGSDKVAPKAIYDQRKRELKARRQHLGRILGR